MSPEDPDRLKEIAKDPLIVAIGEIGLDFFRDHSPRDVQISVFRKLLETASDAGLPVVIHTRAAFDETLAILTEYRKGLKGVLIHCFTEGPAQAERFLDIGCYMSVPGVLTYKNAPEIREAVVLIPKDRLLVETDCPYLAPVPKRSKRNEPSFLPYLLEELGRILGVSADAAADLTSNNAASFFGVADSVPASGDASEASR
jgi:TatD DNase family protein